VGLLGVVGSISVRRTDSPGVAACQRGLESALAMRRSLDDAQPSRLPRRPQRFHRRRQDPHREEPQGRLRWLTRGEATILLTACRKSKNQALADLVEFCMFTGVWLMAGPSFPSVHARRSSSLP